MPTIFTIGHSNHKIEYFLDLLKEHGISCLIDVRSAPVSRRFPQFNLKNLRQILSEHDIQYLHLGEEFGARRENADVLTGEGRVDFEKVRRTEAFQQGIHRLESGIEKGYQIALMCAESHPLDCHRFSMIAVHLDELGWKVQHILKDKSLTCHREMEEKLLKKFAKKLPQLSLFEPNISEGDLRKALYRLHNEAVGWKVA